MWKRLLIRSLFLIIEAFVLYYYGFLKAGLSIYLGLMQEHVVYFETWHSYKTWLDNISDSPAGTIWNAC